MECKPCESKKLMKVFDGSKRKKSRKKRDGSDDNSGDSEDSASHGNLTLKMRPPSTKGSLHELTTGQIIDELGLKGDKHRDQWNRDSSPDVTPRKSHAPNRHHKRSHKDTLSLALKSGRISTPRSISPVPGGDALHDEIPNDQDSFIYNFLEDAIMKHKKKQRHLRNKHDEHRDARDYSVTLDNRHHRRKHRDDKERRYERRERCHGKDSSNATEKMNKQLLETFAKLCTQFSEKANQLGSPSQVRRSLSHKSLQCEVTSKDQSFDDQRPCRLRTRENSQEILPSRIRSHENFAKSSQENVAQNNDNKIKRDYDYSYDKESVKYGSKTDIIRSKDEERFRDYVPPEISRTRSHVEVREYRRDRQGVDRDYDYDDRRRCEQKTSRSCYVPGECYIEDDRCRRVIKRDVRAYDRRVDDRDRKYEERDARDRKYAELEARARRYDERDRKYEDRDRKYEERDVERRYEDRDIRERRYDERDKYDRIRQSQIDVRNRNLNSYIKDRRRSRKIESKCDRMSIASKDDDYNRDRFSERERDSGLSIADDASTLSGKSNYLHVVKQEIAEQREAMDKMMRLWKELMRCFKGNPTGLSGQREKDMQQTACNARDSAAEQLRLWKECMKRYETVARDVGDTDARLMDEINKQRSEMAEMANMWQECLQRYRDISNDFNNLKQKLTTECPTRDTPAPTPIQPPMMCAPHCAEGEGGMPAPQFRMPPNYGPHPQMPMGFMPGTQLRSRASAPPAWWWNNEAPRTSPRRRSSPDSRESPERDRDRRPRHKDHDREPSRYKEKKPSAARSEHRRRKR